MGSGVVAAVGLVVPVGSVLLLVSVASVPFVQEVQAVTVCCKIEEQFTFDFGHLTKVQVCNFP